MSAVRTAPGSSIDARESFCGAAEAIGPVTPGMRLFLVTRGQFSMADMAHHILSEVGPGASLTIWCWAVADIAATAIAQMLSHPNLAHARLIIDRAAVAQHGRGVRSAPTITAWQQRFGERSVSICRNHAKICRVWTADRRVLLRGSMNLNTNPRFEQADITEGCAAFDMIARIEDEFGVLGPTASNAEIDHATGVGKAWEREQLAMFDGLKTLGGMARWQP